MNEDIETNLGGNLSAGVRDKEDGGWYNTVTGYYWRKSNIEHPEPRAYHNSKVALHFNIARLGEAYLNKAEALLLKKDISGAVETLNKTRVAHGGIAPSEATSEAAAWADYIRERNCEMANETGDIYFSYLRWGNMVALPTRVVNPVESSPTWTVRLTRLKSAVTARNCSSVRLPC